jgi:hypothetical protein
VTRYTTSGDVSTIPEINAELEKIALSQVEFVTRNAEAPNAMNASLDMNGNRLINLPAPLTPLEPLRFIDAIGGVAFTVNTDEALVFDNIAEMLLASVVAAQYVRCKRYYASGALVEGLVYEVQPVGYSPDGYIDHGFSNGTSAKLIQSERLYVQQAGARGDNATNDTLPIQAALDYDVALIDFGSSFNTFVFSSLTIRASTTIYLNSVTLKTNLTTGTAVNLEGSPRVSTGSRPRVSIRVYGKRARIGAAISTSDVDLFRINGNVFVEVDGLVFFNTAGHPVVIAGERVTAPPIEVSRDPTSFVLSNIETNTGKGLKLLAGYVGGVDYNSITTGTVRDCFWTVTGANEPAIDMVVNNDQTGGAESIFGVTVSRCSLNSVNENTGRMVRAIATGVSSISLIKFDNIEGEVRGVNTALTHALVELEGVTRSNFQIRGYSDDYNMLLMRNCKNNGFKDLVDSSTDGSQAGLYMVNMDANCIHNTFDNISPVELMINTDFDLTNTNAALAKNFYSKYIDLGYDNTFNGVITSRLERVNRTETLGFIGANNSLLHPDYDTAGGSGNNVWTDNGDETYNVSISTGAPNGISFNVPDYVPLNTFVTILVEYKFNGFTDLGTNWRLFSSVGGTGRNIRIDVTSDWRKVVYITKLTDRLIRFYSGGSFADTSVDIDFRKLEVFTTPALPYVHNYTCTDVKTKFEDEPFTTTALLPTQGNYTGRRFFNTTTNALTTWNGSAWV